MALLVAALGIPATAVATTALVPRNSVGTAQLRNGAVTNPKIRNGAVGNIKIRNNAVGTAKIRNGAVTGAKINLSKVNVTRIVRRISGNQTVRPPRSPVRYPLANNTYTQPRHTVDMYFGSMRVRFPAGCTRYHGERWAGVGIFVDNEFVGSGHVIDLGTGQVTTQEGFTVVQQGRFTTAVHRRRVTAEVLGYCGNNATARPHVLAVHVNVARFR